MLGIRQIFRLAADQVFANATPATVTGFSFPVAVGQVISGRIRVLATVGATGGLRAGFSTPAATTINSNTTLQNTVAPATVAAASLTGATFTNALANAGTHFLDIEFDAVITTAGTFAFQMGQNTTDALTLNVEAGSFMEIVVTNV